MRQHLACAIASSALAGCSLIYNPNNLPGAPPEAGIDAPPDVEIVLDANPSLLELTEIDPPQIFEGQGDGGSRPALVVIGGHHIIDNATTVAIAAASGTANLTLGTPVIAKNGNWIAIPVTARVDATLARGATRSLTVTVTQTLPAEMGGGTKMAELAGALTLVGFDELDDGDLPMTGKLNAAQLHPMYSQVDISARAVVVFGGTERARIRSVSSIKAAALEANGAPGGSGRTDGEVGGCGGGAPETAGSCPEISGGGGRNTGLLGSGGGGGGGGFAGNGSPGNGSIAGPAGAGTGDDQIATYDGNARLSQNRAGGGGGGGPTLDLLGLTPGGGGGASGGSIELTAGGDLAVGNITANGGPGQTSNVAGGGGGGAGGLVLLRADGRLTTSGTISVRGGAGGNGNLRGETNKNSGGVGADGRVRWDAPAGSEPTVAAGPRTVHRGPSFQLTTQVFRITDPTLTVIGTPGDAFEVSADHEGMTYRGAPIVIGPGGLATFPPPLHQGHNRVCLVFEDADPTASEARTCVDIAFLP